MNLSDVYRNKLVVVVGGSSGIGFSTARMLAGFGANVIIIARNKENLEKAAQNIRLNCISNQQIVEPLQTDITDHAQVALMADQVTNLYGTPDFLINSAGKARQGLCNDLTIDEYRWMMDLNLHGTVNTVKAFLPGMLQRKSGHIVNISSIAGFLSVYSYTAYSASKFAVKGFTDALRVELTTDHTGVELSIVFPPDTEGESLEKERAYKPAILVAADEGTPSMTGDAVARAILEGVAKKHYIITPGLWSNLYFKLVGLTGGGLLYTVLDLIFADARNKVRRNPAKYQYHPKG